MTKAYFTVVARSAATKQSTLPLLRNGLLRLRSQRRFRRNRHAFRSVDLQLFVAVADARSITAGAVRVHLALASASERIKGLEEALGVALLKRGRRGVELTAAGESLLDHARIVLHNVEAMPADLSAYPPRINSSLHLRPNTSRLPQPFP